MGRRYVKGSPAERFEVRVQRGEGCWEYEGYRFNGYGKFGVSPSESVLAHRFAYELWIGPIPEGAVVHHDCENPACVRPDHLSLKTNEGHSYEHTYGRGVVENQYGTWPVAVTAEERRIRNRDWMRAFRARQKEQA